MQRWDSRALQACQGSPTTYPDYLDKTEKITIFSTHHAEPYTNLLNNNRKSSPAITDELLKISLSIPEIP